MYDWEFKFLSRNINGDLFPITPQTIIPLVSAISGSKQNWNSCLQHRIYHPLDFSMEICELYIILNSAYSISRFKNKIIQICWYTNPVLEIVCSTFISTFLCDKSEWYVMFSVSLKELNFKLLTIPPSFVTDLLLYITLY